jgi:predicted MFS family arabinose efflux permease
MALFLVGPFLAAAAIAAAGARTSLVVAAALTVAGGVPFGFLARGAPDRRDAERGRLTAAIRLPGMRTLFAATILTDAALGAIEFAVAAFARDRGDQAIAGVLLGVFCASSVLGGLAYGARSWRLSPGRRLVVLQAVAMALLLPLPFAGSLAPFGVLLALAGAPFAAAWATSSLSVDDVAPPVSAGEAYSLLNAGNGVGVALGGAAAGALTQIGGPSAALVAAAPTVGLAAVWTLGRLGTLAPRPRGALDRA